VRVIAQDVRLEAVTPRSTRLSCEFGELELSGVAPPVLEAFFDDLERSRDPGGARGRLCDALGVEPGRQVFEALVPLVLADAGEGLLGSWDRSVTTLLEGGPSLARGPAETLELLRLLTRQGAGAMPHAVDGFKDHLVGVWRILVRWGQPPAIATAGLLHSIYATASFHRPLLSLRQRRTVASLAGEVAEGLAYLFCTLDRFPLWARLDRAHDGSAQAPAVNFRTGRRWSLGPRTQAALAVIELANLIEQRCDEHGAPAAGIAQMCRVVGRLAEHLDVVPPIVGRGAAALRDADEVAAVARYDAALDPSATQPRRQRALVAAARLNPWVGEPLIVLAESGGNSPTARRVARAGLRRLEAWGDAWDKRTPFEAWQQRAYRVLHRANHGEYEQSEQSE